MTASEEGKQSGSWVIAEVGRPVCDNPSALHKLERTVVLNGHSDRNVV